MRSLTSWLAAAAWIISSHDKGVTWNLTATPTTMFPGRLAAPRFVQYGKNNEGAPDDYVYVYFPGTQGDAAFCECPRVWVS